MERHATCRAVCYGDGMSQPDFNLLAILDVLLAEGSVARAARRLRLSPSAMSRALSRLRDVTGDPLLVRAGRGLVPTPHAAELRERVSRLVEEVNGVLRPTAQFDISRLVRTFTLRSSEGFAETFGPALVEHPTMGSRFVVRFPHQPHWRGQVGWLVDQSGTAVGTIPGLRTADRFERLMHRDHEVSYGEHDQKDDETRRT